MKSISQMGILGVYGFGEGLRYYRSTWYVADAKSVNVGLRQGCVMSPWLFNVYMDGVVREVNVRVLGKGL